MKKQLLTLLLTAASLAGYADVPAGLPTTLPDGVYNYELVTSDSPITIGDQYVIRYLLPQTVTYNSVDYTFPDGFLTNVSETINSETVSVAKFQTLDSISDPSDIIWTAKASGNSTYPYAFTNNGRYFCYRHGSTTYASSVIYGGGSKTVTNLARGIYTQESLLDPNCCFSFEKTTTPNDTTTTAAKDGIETVYRIGGTATNASYCAVTYNRSYSWPEFGAFSASFWGYMWTNTDNYCISNFFAIYRVISVAEKLEKLKATYKAQLSTSNEKAQKYGVDAGSFTTYIEKIDAVTAATAAEVETAETEMQKIVAEAASVEYTDAEVNQMIIDRYNGKYILLKNARTDGNVRYLDMEKSGDKCFTAWSADISAANVWKMSIEENSADDSDFKVSLYNPYIGKYCYTTTRQAEAGAIASEDKGFLYLIPASTDGTTYEFLFPEVKASTDATEAARCYLYNNSSEKAINWTTGSDYSKWILSFLTDEQATDIYETLKTEVSALTYSDGSTTSFGYDDVALYGDDLNQFKDPLGKLQAQFKTTVASASANDFGDIVEAYNTAKTGAETLDATEKGSGINMPVAGSYIRVKASPASLTHQSATGPLYLTCVNSASNSSTASIVSSIDSDENLLNTILYYTGETLSGYSNGLYLTATAGSTLHALEDITASPLSISIDASTAEAGAYLIDYAGTTEKPICFLYILIDGVTGKGVMESITDLEAETWAVAFHVQLEYVEELPVTVGTDGTATLCVPVAVTIPEGADCYAAVVNNGKTLQLASAPAGTSYAAHTAIFIKGTAGQIVKFPIASTGAETYVCDEFRGNAVKSSFTAADGTVTYAPATKPSTASLAPGMRRVEASGTSVYFAKTSDTLDANTPILTLSQETLGSTDAVEAFEVEVKDGETVKLELTVTSVSELTTEQPADNAPVYDLMGRRVLNPQHGLFIMNGKIFRK